MAPTPSNEARHMSLQLIPLTISLNKTVKESNLASLYSVYFMVFYKNDHRSKSVLYCLHFVLITHSDVLQLPRSQEHLF